MLDSIKSSKMLDSTRLIEQKITARLDEPSLSVLIDQIEAEMNPETQRGYYKPPPMETLHKKVAEFAYRKLPHSGSLFGLQDIPGSQDIRNQVSKVAATIILQKAAAEIMASLEKEIEKDGVDALRKYVFGNNQ